MKRVIFKYEIPVLFELFEKELPLGAEILKIGLDARSKPSMWCMVNPDVPTEMKKFAIVGTGQTVPDGYWYVNSFTQAPFVWHLFERLR